MKILKIFFITLTFLTSLLFCDELGFIDGVTINSREFDDINDRSIVFYEEDLEDGKVVIEGIFEDNEDDTIDPNQLAVKISTNGGSSWTNASLQDEDWNFSFVPEIDKEYQLRVKVAMKVDSTTTNTDNVEDSDEPETILPKSSYKIAGFDLHVDVPHSTFNSAKISGQGYINVPWLPNAKQRINVVFTDLGLNARETQVSSGNINFVFTPALVIDRAGVRLTINQVNFNGTQNKATITGSVTTTADELLKDFGTLNIDNVAFTRDGLAGSIAFTKNININIYQAQNVKLKVSQIVSLININKTRSSLKLQSITAKLDFGTLFAVDPFDVTYDKINKKIIVLYTGVIDYHGSKISNLNGFYSIDNKTITFGGKLKFPNDVMLKNSMGFDFHDFTISQRGFNGIIDGTLNQNFWLVQDSVKVKVNSAKVTLSSASPYVSLTNLNMGLDFHKIFSDGVDSVTLSKTGDTYAWSLPGTVSLPGFPKGNFENIRGQINSENFTDMSSMQLSTKFWYTDFPEHKISVTNAMIKSDGFYGSVAYSNGNKDVLGIKNLKLKNIALNFAANKLTGEGNILLTYFKNRFLGTSERLDLEIGAVISQDHISFHSQAENMQLNINNFADININHISLDTNDVNDFKIKLSGLIKPTNSTFSTVQSLELQGITVSKSGISIDGAGVEIDVSGASGSLGGLSLSLETLSMGFEDSKLYIGAKGMLGLTIAEAGAGLKLYSDKTISVDSIHIEVNQPTLTFGGEIVWYKNHATFGNGFGTSDANPLRLSIANMFRVKGWFKIGNHPEKGFYWMAKAQGGAGSGIPLGPVTMYEVGGGVAYNMSIAIDPDNLSSQFVPSGTNNINLILSSLIGTPDMGYTWHGQLEIIFDSDGQIVLTGDSYLLDELDNKPSDRHISAAMTMGFAPASFQLQAYADINYKGIGVKGGLDLLINDMERHLYIGTKNIQGFNIENDLGLVEVKFVMDFFGYFMINANQLALGGGVRVNKTVSLDWYGPDPWARINIEAGMDALIQYKPFFMDARAYAHFDLSAGYGSVSFGSLSAGVDLNFRAPDPTYIKVKAYMDLPRNIGRVSFTAYFPERPRSTSPIIPDLISSITPMYEKDIALAPDLKIQTTFPVIKYAHGEDYIGEFVSTTIEDDSGDDQGYSSKLYNVKLRDTVLNQFVVLEMEAPDIRTAVFHVKNLLIPNHTYEFSAQAVLKDHKGRELSNKRVVKNFKTASDLSPIKLIKRIEPANFSTTGTSQIVRVRYTDIVKRFGIDNSVIKNAFSLHVTNSKGEEIAGEWLYFSRRAGDYSEFKPEKALRYYYYCVDNDTGEVLQTFRDEEGNFINPFKSLGHTESSTEQASRQNTDDSSEYNTNNTLSNFLNNNNKFDKYKAMSGNGRYTYYVNDKYNIIVKNKNGETEMMSTFFLEDSNPNDTVNTILGDDINPTITIHRNRDYDNKMRFDIDDDINGGAYSNIDLTFVTESGDEIIKKFRMRETDRDGRIEFIFAEPMYLENATIEYGVRGVSIKKLHFEIIHGEDYDTRAEDELQAQADEIRENQDQSHGEGRDDSGSGNGEATGGYDDIPEGREGREGGGYIYDERVGGGGDYDHMGAAEDYVSVGVELGAAVDTRVNVGVDAARQAAGAAAAAAAKGVH